MNSLIALLTSAFVPWTSSLVLERLAPRIRAERPGGADERSLARHQRATLAVGVLLVIGAILVGALSIDAELVGPRPVAAAWLMASLCGTTAWIALALGHRTPDGDYALSAQSAFERAVQTAALPVTASGIALAAIALANAFVAFRPAAVVAGALLATAGVLVGAPSVMTRAGVWPVSRSRLWAGGRRWTLARIPVPSRRLAHIGASPWLSTVWVSDGLVDRLAPEHRDALLRFEASAMCSSHRAARVRRWAIALSLTLVSFSMAQLFGTDPARLVALTFLAVGFAFGSAWVANRQPVSHLASDPLGPSARELAAALRHLPAPYGTIVPRTSRRSLSQGLYNRLFALGHDPGPRARG